MAKKEEKVKKKRTFFKDFKAELKRVTWPTTKQLVNNTMGVIVIVIIVAIIVFVLDLAFESINKYGVNGLKEAIQNSSSAETTLEDEDATVNDTESTEPVNETGETTTENTTTETAETDTDEAADTTEQE